VVNTGLGEHGIVLNLRLAQRRAVVRDDDQLGGALAQGLQGRLVAEQVSARLHDEREARVDRLGLLLLQNRSSTESNVSKVRKTRQRGRRAANCKEETKQT
jgi:hypothetical protein